MLWKEAHAKLKRANPSLADAFDQFYHQLDDDTRNTLDVSIKSYPFTTRILDTGTPHWPDGVNVDDDYIVAKGLPFGVILSNCCEVFEYTIPLFPDSPKPTALLSKGDCIGLFELFDMQDGHVRGRNPDWNISAGSVNVRSLFNFDTAGARRDLKKLFGNFDTDRFRDCLTLSEKAMFIPQVEAMLSDWRVDILFFNKHWFNCLFASKAGSGDGGIAASRLKNELHTTAWRSVSRIRAANTSFRRFFSRGLRTNADMHLVESSHDFAATVADAIYQRSPVFILDRDSDDVAPVKVLCDTLLKPFMSDPIAVRPAYLGEHHEVGFMPLDYISPYIVSHSRVRLVSSSQSTRSRIISMSEKIRNASDLVISEQVDLPVLAELDQLLDHVAFRVPSTNSSPNGGERASAEFRLSLSTSPARIRNVEEIDMSTATFFQPYLRELENQRCEFFRTCARIEAFRPAKLEK